MKRSHALLAMVSIVMLIAICLIAMPFIFLGAPSSLFSIDNKDVNEHKVVIEILNSNNESVFKQKYELAPGASISQSKPTRLLLELSIPPGNTKECTIKATLDEDVTETRQIELQPWVTAHIILYESNAETPLCVMVSSA